MLEDNKIGKYQKNFKSNIKYMQKYHKSLTFFQDKDDEVFKRDYNIPVGMDTFDKSALPTRMQTRGD